MEKILTKYFWIFNLAALAIVAFFVAGGTAEMVASGLSDVFPVVSPQDMTPARTAVPQSPRNLLAARDGTDILRRNIFDSVVGPIIPGEDDPPDGVISLEGDMPIVPCPSGDSKLLSTVASSNNPEWSFATIQTGSATDLYRIGDTVGDRVLSGITWRYILLRGNSDECYIDMFGDQQDVKKVATRRSSDDGDAAMAAGIRVDGPNERTVDRSVVDQALANPTQFARSVRVRPYKKDGEVVGFRLRRIKKGSPIEMLGAQKGDIIHSVNGVDLTSIDQALAAYQNMRSESKLVFSITRAGKPVDLNINIR
jgi:general secretion pathway protein C